MALHAAVLAKDYAAAETLLEGGAEVNSFENNLCPLDIAVAQNDERMVAILLKHRANPRYTRLQPNLLQRAVSSDQRGVETMFKPFYTSSERVSVRYHS